MKRALAFAFPVAFAAGLAVAQVAAPAVEDADGSGDYSLAELQTVWPELTEDGFAGLDADGNGAVDAAELQAALDSGTLIAPAAQ